MAMKVRCWRCKRAAAILDTRVVSVPYCDLTMHVVLNNTTTNSISSITSWRHIEAFISNDSPLPITLQSPFPITEMWHVDTRRAFAYTVVDKDMRIASILVHMGCYIMYNMVPIWELEFHAFDDFLVLLFGVDLPGDI